jgi:hypothetical protein
MRFFSGNNRLWSVCSVYLHTGPQTHGPSPPPYPQFIADRSRFLTGLLSGAVAWANELPAENLLLSC